MNRRRRRATEAATTITRQAKPGTYVSWAGSSGKARGKVVSVHQAGKVPGVPMVLEASADAPAARVQLFAKHRDGWVATGTHVAVPLAGLEGIDALSAPTVEAAPVGEMSFDDLSGLVCDAICDRIEMAAGVEVDCYVLDIGIGWAVYTVCGSDGDLWLVDWSIDGAGAVTLGDPIEVYRQTTYMPDPDTGEMEPAAGPAAVTPPAGSADIAGETGTGALVSMGEAVRDRQHGRLLAAGGTDPTSGGRVFRVQIIQHGDSKNGRRYPQPVLAAAAQLYEGAKAYDHHRDDAELASSTVRGIVGHYRGVEANTAGLEADLVLLPSAAHTAELLDASLANQAAGLPPLVGISHDVYARHRQVMAGGKQIMEATAIVQVNSADVVAEPAAGGQALRMVAAGGHQPSGTNTDPSERNPMKFKQLLALLRSTEAAGRAALLAQHTDVLDAAGMTEAEVLAIAAADAGPARTAEATHPRSSLLVRNIVDIALRTAKLPEHMAEGVIAELGEHTTEAEIVAKVGAFRKVAEGLELAGLAPTVTAADPKVTLDERDKKIAKLDAMFAGNYREGYKSLRTAWADITGYTGAGFLDTEEINRRIMRESIGDPGRDLYDSARATESVSSGTWSTILGDSVTRRMVAEYSQPSLRTWEAIVSSVVPVSDFRTQRIERMGGYGTLPAVNQGAPYQPLTSPGNEEVTYAITKRGGTEDLTLETIANDDLRAVLRIPTKLGLAAAQTLFRFVWDFLNTNPTLYDSVALFNAGHSNATTTALSSTALETTRKNMRKQTAYGDTADILSLVPKYLVVPPDLEALAFELCTSAVAIPSGAPVGAASNTPNLHQGMTPIVVDYFSATSATEWFVVADPAMCPTIELGFYNGQQDPAMFVQSDATVGSVFTADKVTYKIRHIYSGAVLDFRGFSRGNT